MNLFFNELIQEDYMDYLKRKSIGYLKKSKANVEEYYENKNDQELSKSLVFFYKNRIKCNLILSFIQELKIGKNYVGGNNVIHIRDEAIFGICNKFEDMVDRGLYKPWDFYKFIEEANQDLNLQKNCDTRMMNIIFNSG
jgi:hypothetical protein